MKSIFEAIDSGLMLWPLKKKKKGILPLEINAHMKKFQELFLTALREPDQAYSFVV